MKYRILAGVVLSGWVAGAAWAADAPALKDTKEKFSYGLGMSLGNNLKRSGIAMDQLDSDFFARGLKDGMGSGKTLLTEAEARDVIMAAQRDARTQLAERNKKASEAFLAENKTKEGVVTLPSGLQYKVLAEGTGESPKPSDMVTVNYRGTLLDGTEFDSSYKRGQPAKFAVGGVIKGWSEALQKMKSGAKWELAIPAELAYGERGSGMAIGPNATLKFEVELMSFEPRPAPQTTPAAPVTSDIIRVPSKEQLDKGDKIEVIKPQDLEKYKQAEKEKADKEKADKEKAAQPDKK